MAGFEAFAKRCLLDVSKFGVKSWKQQTRSEAIPQASNAAINKCFVDSWESISIYLPKFENDWANCFGVLSCSVTNSAKSY